MRQELSGMEREGSRWPESDAAVGDLYLDDDTKNKPAAAANVEVGVDKQVDDDEEVEHFAASEIEKHNRKQGEEEEEEEEAQEPFMGSGETSLIRTEEALFQLDSVFTCNTDLQSVVGRCFVEVIMVCLKFFFTCNIPVAILSVEDLFFCFGFVLQYPIFGGFVLARLVCSFFVVGVCEVFNQCLKYVLSTGWACRWNVEIMEEIGSQSSLLMALCVQRFALLKMRLQ